MSASMEMGSVSYRFLKSFFSKIDYYKDKILEISITKMILLFIITLFTLTSVHFLLFMHGYVSIGSGNTFIMDHALYNTIKGEGLMTIGGIEHYPEYFKTSEHPAYSQMDNYLGDAHKKIILVLILPIYYLWPSLFNLLLIQCVVLGLAAYPLYKICNHFLDGPTSKIITISYFLYPTIILTGIVGFHVPAFAPLFVFSMFYFYLNKKSFLHLISLILLLTLFENMFLVSIPIAIYYIFDTHFNTENLKARLYKYSLPAIFMTIVYYWIFIYHIIGPIFSSGENLLFSSFGVTHHFGYLGSNPQEMILNSLSNPWLIINVPHILKFIAYAFVMLLPLAFIPLLNKNSIMPLLMASLIVFQNILSHDPTTESWYNRFQAIVIPFLFLSMIVSVSELQKEKYLKYFDKYYIYYALVICIIYCSWYVLSYVFGTRIYCT